jgi:hypothetical protein
MSRLVKEDDEFLYLYRYLHDSKDEFSEWEMNPDGSNKYSDAIQEAEAYAFYEVRVDYRINKKTAQVILDKVTR